MKIPVYVTMSLDIIDVPWIASLLGKNWPTSFWYGINGKDMPVYLANPQFMAWIMRRMRELRRQEPHKHAQSKSFRETEKRFRRLLDLANQSLDAAERRKVLELGDREFINPPRRPPALGEIIPPPRDLEILEAAKENRCFWWVPVGNPDYGHNLYDPQRMIEAGQLTKSEWEFYPRHIAKPGHGQCLDRAVLLVEFSSRWLASGRKLPSKVMARHRWRVEIVKKARPLAIKRLKEEIRNGRNDAVTT